MVSRLCDDGVQGRDGRCVENSSCFQIFLFVPVCILLLGSHFLLFSIVLFDNTFFRMISSTPLLFGLDSNLTGPHGPAGIAASQVRDDV